jgi:hypothetical protein
VHVELRGERHNKDVPVVEAGFAACLYLRSWWLWDTPRVGVGGRDERRCSDGECGEALGAGVWRVNSVFSRQRLRDRRQQIHGSVVKTKDEGEAA